MDAAVIEENWEKNWHTDRELFAALEGGQQLIDWFGFVPSFHDATLQGIEWQAADISMYLNAFRMTDRVDGEGYFQSDRHTTVRLELHEVAGVLLSGNVTTIIGQLRIRSVEERQLETDPRIASIRFSCGGPRSGDYEVDFTSSYGLWGVIFARRISVSHVPAEPGLK